MVSLTHAILSGGVGTVNGQTPGRKAGRDEAKEKAMANFNKVLLIGNLTRDPELKYTQGGTAVCELGLAVNRSYTRQSGEKVEETCFVDCEAWGRQAETISQYMSKGRPIFIEGRLKYDTWETQDGQKRSKLRVVCENFQFLGGRGEGGGGPAPQQQRPQQNPQQQARRPQQQSRPQEPSVQESPPDDDFNLDDIPF
jgi:single-strand DNA-binding protein